MAQPIPPIEIPPEAWVPNSGLDNPLDRLLYHGRLFVCGVPMHLEAWRVDETDDTQRHAFDEDLGALATAVGADGPFTTANIEGHEYVIVATPFCR